MWVFLLAAHESWESLHPRGIIKRSGAKGGTLTRQLTLTSFHSNATYSITSMIPPLLFCQAPGSDLMVQLMPISAFLWDKFYLWDCPLGIFTSISCLFMRLSPYSLQVWSTEVVPQQVGRRATGHIHTQLVPHSYQQNGSEEILQSTMLNSTSISNKMYSSIYIEKARCDEWSLLYC